MKTYRKSYNTTYLTESKKNVEIPTGDQVQKKNYPQNCRDQSNAILLRAGGIKERRLLNPLRLCWNLILINRLEMMN